LLNSIIFSRNGLCDPRVHNDNVELPKIGLNLLDGGFDFRLACYVRFVGAGGDVIRGGDLGGEFVGVGGGVVDQGDLGLLLEGSEERRVGLYICASFG
jgi:hypothetical protein